MYPRAPVGTLSGCEVSAAWDRLEPRVRDKPMHLLADRGRDEAVFSSPNQKRRLLHVLQAMIENIRAGLHRVQTLLDNLSPPGRPA